MSKLDDLIAELCPNGVKYYKLSEVFDLFSGMSGVTNKWAEDGNCQFIDYMNAYSHLAIDVHDLPFATVKKLEQTVLKQGDVLFTSASETPDECAISSVIEDAIQEGVFLDDHLFGLRIKNNFKNCISPSFLKYTFSSEVFRSQIKKAVRGATRFYISKPAFMKLTIPVPPLPVQREIVRILDNFTERTAELTAELTARKKQYEYYRDSLLMAQYGTPLSTIGNLCSIKGRIGFRGYTQKDFVRKGEGAISLSPGNIISNHLRFDDCKYITWEKYYESPEIMLSEKDVILCKTGSTVGKVAVVDNLPEKATLNPQLVVFKDIRCDYRYLFYQLSSSLLQRKIKALAGVGSVPNISQQAISKIEIPVPSFEEQCRIVRLLDHFDTLCNDYSSGLPAEIKARQKQYEYYRDKLLTFKEL